VTYSCIQSSSVDNYYEEIMGTRGTVLLSNENESYLFWEPGWDETKAKKVADDEKEAREAKTTQIEVVKEDAAESAFSAHVSPSATVSGGASGMSPTEPYRYELRGFAHTIRSNAANLCDGERASKALMACLYGKKSLEAKQRLEIPANIVARA
jgi:predicted dehydrogenase